MGQFTALWTLVALVLAVLEAVTFGLVCIWFCIGAVAAVIVSLITTSLWIQFLTFVAVSAVTLAFTRKFVKRFVDVKKTPTNADALIGCNGVVTVDIDPVENVGQIKVNGQIWSAKAECHIPAGTIVKVKGISGVKAVVCTL